MHKNIPNILTIIRIICIPIIVSTFYFENIKFAHQLGAGLFLFASLTDFFDGYYARKYGIQSNFGEMFDPIADKVLVGVVIVMLVKFNKANEIPALLILAREFTIAGLREFLAQLRVSIPVTFLAKIKTGVQMGALFVLMLGPNDDTGHWLNILGSIWLWVAAFLTIITGMSYFKAGLKYATEER